MKTDKSTCPYCGQALEHQWFDTRRETNIYICHSCGSGYTDESLNALADDECEVTW